MMMNDAWIVKKKRLSPTSTIYYLMVG